MSIEWRVAQLNVGTAKYSLEDQCMSRFVGQLGEINALADRSPGFVWRLQSEIGNATDIRVGDDPLLIVNMSVWLTVEALFDFAYKSAHRRVVADRRSWFKRPDGPYQVLWWVPAGHRPTVEEGMTKLTLLRESGPSREAFTFETKYLPPGQSGVPEDLNPAPFCRG